MAVTILQVMEELKTCLFCGRSVDRTYEFCPHCGYEFILTDDLPALPEEAILEASRENSPQDYIGRIRSLQDLLSDMERELDFIIKTSSKGP